MRNWMRTVVISAVMAISGVPVHAFVNDESYTGPSLYSCGITGTVDVSLGAASLTFMGANGAGTLAAGAKKWSGFSKVDHGVQGEITSQTIADCLQTNATNITNLTLKGADAGTYAAQEYMGFSFILTVAAGGLSTGYHPYFIGTPPATNAPTALVATAGNGQVPIAFTAPSYDGGAPITDYEYQLDSGTWISAVTTSSPVVITGLTNGTAYSIKLRAVNSVGNGTESAAVLVTPAPTPNAPSAPTPNAPTALVATAGNGQVSIAFTAPSNNGGAAITDYEYELGGSGTWTSASIAATPVVITGLTNGSAYSIKLRAVNSAGNGTESAAVSVLLESPASEFAANKDVIRSVISSDVQRSLRSTISSNRTLSQNARQRFIEQNRTAQECEELGNDGTGCTAEQTPFDVDGTASFAGGVLSTRGTFGSGNGDASTGTRRLFFGDFDIQRDADGSTTATLNARRAWEQMLSDQTMFGYFAGGSFANSNIAGAFAGSNTKFGVEAGVYAVHQLGEALYLDGFASLGAGRNDLEIANGVLALESNYTTKTATLGAAVSGVIDQGSYEVRPELAFSYGKTWIGDVGFTGTAYGMTDDTLSLDAGNVTLASLTFRPEFIIPLDGRAVSDSNTLISFAPRLICEYVKTTTSSDYCGGGAEVGLSSVSDDGLSTADIKLIMDRIDNGTRSSVQFGLEHKF